LTISPEEFENVRKILKLQKKYGGQVPGIVHVFYAEKTTDNMAGNVYQIYTEHVQQLDSSVANTVELICGYRLGQDSAETGPLIGEIFHKAKIEKRYHMNYVKYVSVVGRFLRLVASLNRVAPNGRHTFWDLHDFNIGVKDNGEYVLFDIGRIYI